ncbi:MAG: VCBS repeat-containing protein [Phycisphaerales bacterium]|nr:VCBS repeat-containing protein [Phycisphaerales bacterium]
MAARFARSLRTLVCLVVVLIAPGAVAQLSVVSISPTRNANNVDLFTSISINFDRPLDTATVTSQSFWAFGRISGPAVGAISFSNGDQTATLTPDRRLQVGETVTVFVANTLRAADGSALRASGYSWQFTTRTRCAGLEFQQIASMSNRVNGAQTRIYGGITTDFNSDGWVDIATINEVSADMRMFLNRADGSGLYDPMLLPPAPLMDEVSPNEPGDFNRDGIADFAVASSATSHVCILLGNGDGTFAPGQFLPTGGNPHGVAVADVDGDGDADVMTANSGGSNISRFLNNGAGVFGPATNFEGGGNGEYGLIAADMTSDGVLDLLVGNNGSQTCTLLRGNGNGTFTLLTTRNIGGAVWVVNAADVNNDGHMDVVSANSFSANGAVLLGNGAGGLSAATVYPSTGHTASTDVGDLDGDGDQDWILSSFGGSNWRIYRNNGNGTFTYVTDVAAPANPSCAALYDTDNDGDLDVALFDEIADVVIIRRNTATRHAGDLDLDGDVDLADLSRLLASFGTGSGAILDDGDIDGDGDVDLADLAGLLATFGQAC